MQKKSLLIVDDHPMVTEGLKAIFKTSDSMVVEGTAGNAKEALSVLASRPMDIALVDINLPETNGIDLCRTIKSTYPHMMVLGMSSFQERSYISQMILAGASGFLVKSASRDEILEAVKAALEGKLFLSVDIGNNLTTPPDKGNPPALTHREKEVLKLIAEGYTNPQIADKLFVSPHTVDSHRKNLLNKFEVRNTAALINLAVKYNLLDQ